MKNIRNFVRKVISQMSNKPKRIPFDYPLPENVMKLSRIFNKAGYDLHVVGGAVRDMLMKKMPKDYDLVSDATPDEVENLLGGLYKTIPTGKAFGVITVVMPDGEEYEIAKHRTDVGSGRRPEGGVKFSTIDQDVKRRDLTINALYYDIAKREIIDYVGGVEDIMSNKVKTVGSAKQRFEEDRLRILRAFRFAARLGSELDSDIQKALKKNNSLEGVSKERIRDEFIKGVKSAMNVVDFLVKLEEFGMLEQILEGLTYKKTFFINEQDPEVLLANLLKDNSVLILKEKLANMRYTLEEISKISFLVTFRRLEPSNVFKMKKLQKASGITSDEIRKFAKWNNMEDNLVKKFLSFELSVSGDELLKKGFKGKQVGEEMEKMEIQNFIDFLA